MITPAGPKTSRWRRLILERQVYVRSGGKVAFYAVGVGAQFLAAVLLAVFLAWIAFSSVTVIFKDWILAAHEHRFQQQRAVLENRMADLQIAYESLTAGVTALQIRADRIVESLEARQENLVTSAGFLTEPKVTEVSSSTSSNVVAPTNVGNIKSSLPRDERASSQGGNPNLDQVALDIARLEKLSLRANQLMAKLDLTAVQRAQENGRLIASTGIDAESFLRKFRGAVGGPEIPLDNIRLRGIVDQEFNLNYFKAEADFARLALFRQALNRLPVAAPVGPQAERTSGFGPRRDPFTGQFAFHTGVDFTGPNGTQIRATGPGRVVFAGPDGNYGNMVEIDHGMGLKTRYAHLLSISVAEGAFVAKGNAVGRLGSTGRSTGPHVHYEVWYDNVVRNPSGFLALGARSQLQSE